MPGNKLRVVRIISILTTAAIMIAIFMFSAQNREQSSNLSHGFTKQVVNMISAVVSMSVSEKIRIVDLIHGTVRKLAHFSIYAALGISSSAMFTSFLIKSKRRNILIYSVIFCFLYAASDEIHQLFVGGRGSQVTDVLLDSFGAFCGGMVFLMFIKLINRKGDNYD